jgi:FMN hydrolase / 5-amino-6-(5-phospho-D-ribitylamino)uracil phosphatase
MISTVVFDADDTLVDIRTAVIAGLTAVSAVTGISVDELDRDAVAFWAAIPEKAARQIRIAALLYTLTNHGLAARIDEMVELFFRQRYANSRPFPGVIEMLTVLRRAGYQLGYATNANSRADLCGLGGCFDFEIYALEGGVPKKPHADFFHAMLAAAGARPEEVVYVGDSYDHDVVGAAAVGIRTVWLNRTAAPVSGDVRPDAVVADLTTLSGVLGKWGRLSFDG